VDCWNCNHTGLLLQHGGGRIGLHYGDGRFYQILDHIRHDSCCTWSKTDPDIFYFVSANCLYKFDVSNNQITLVYKFTQYVGVDIGGGEGDISEDGNYLPMIGDLTQPFLFGLQQNMIMDGPYSISGLNAVYVSTDNHLIATGLAGVQLLKPGPALIAYKQEHMDVGRDLDGSPIVVWLDDRNNAVTKIRLSDMKMTPLLTLDWKLALHICLPARAGYAIVSPYAPGGEDVSHAHDILKVQLDGSAPTVLAQHHSDATGQDGYQGQPHAVGSGNQFLFDSREGGQSVVYIGSL